MPLATHSITPNNEIVLNVSSTEDVIDVVKSELVDEEEEEESAVDPVVCDASTLIIPWPAFVPVASHPELAGQRRKRKAAAPSAGSAADKRARSRLEDVTDQYVEEETDENQVCTVMSVVPAGLPIRNRMDPHCFWKLDPDPNPYCSENLDPDPH